MLTLQHPTASSPHGKSKKCTPNLLPVRINHNGPIHNTERYFKPTIPAPSTKPAQAPSTTASETTDNATQAPQPDEQLQHVHFRGRHLHGTPLALPANYTGAIVHVPSPSSSAAAPSKPISNDFDEEGEGEDRDEINVDVHTANVLAEFDEFVVWGHAEAVDEGRDAFVRGVKEWVGFAESMHLDEEDEVKA